MAAPAVNATRVSSEGVVTAHILVSTAFLAVGSLLYLASTVAVAFPFVLGGAFSYGRVRPAALVALMVGWLVISFTGGAYYLIPRLTGARLASPALARMGMALVALVTLVGVVASILGLGDGSEPFGLPLWLDLPLLIATLIPLVIAVRTVRARTEQGVYVSLWFVLAGLVWLPMLQAAATWPVETSLARLLQGVTFTAGFSTLWVAAMGVGLAYYAVVKLTDQPLANRQLARVGFWSLAFAGTWAGPAQIVFGPTPDWLDGVAAVLTLALPVAAIANGVGLAATIVPSWGEVRTRPTLASALTGAAFALLVGVATAVAAFRSAASLVGFTPYWDGVLAGTLFGVGGSFVAAWTYQAIPAVAGLELGSSRAAYRHLGMTVWGTAATMILMMASGVVTGYGWAAGAYTGVAAAGDTWATLTSSGRLLLGLSLAPVLVMVGGQLSLVLTVLQNLTAGRATVQEVLVPKGAE